MIHKFLFLTLVLLSFGCSSQKPIEEAERTPSGKKEDADEIMLAAIKKGWNDLVSALSQAKPRNIDEYKETLRTVPYEICLAFRKCSSLVKPDRCYKTAEKEVYRLNKEEATRDSDATATIMIQTHVVTSMMVHQTSDGCENFKNAGKK
jgi:hypothetical protein